MLIDLSHYGLIKVHGEDSESFLQNQLTNDIRHVSDSTHQESAWCSPKGRIIANFRVFKQADSYVLILSADLVELIIKRFNMYKMMSKVAIEDVSHTLKHFALIDDASKVEFEDCFAKESIATNSEKNQTINYKNVSILKLDGESPRYQILGNLEDTQNLWDQLSNSNEIADANAWTYANIIAGRPFITEASSEAWIPQMVNYIAVDGVDFKKGCYPGQEVVARLNYLGKTKRRMYRILLDTDKLPAINDVISSESDKSAGKILNTAINPGGKIEALAVLKIATTSEALRLADNESATLSILDLPYPINDD